MLVISFTRPSTKATDAPLRIPLPQEIDCGLIKRPLARTVTPKISAFAEAR